MSFKNKILKNLSDFNIDCSSKILVAVSGGIDSLCLAHFLHGQNYNISICHINHKYHDSADEMEKLVENFCSQYSIPFFTSSINSKQIDSNIESIFRKKRYDILYSIADEQDFEYIFTGHHYDDQIETLIFRFFNSSGLNNLFGLKKQFRKVLRPMLNIYKKEIINYARNNNISYIDDPTNLNLKFSRNFIRNVIIKDFNKISSNLYIPFENFEKRIRESNEVINYTTDYFLQKNNLSKNSEILKFCKKSFFNLPILIQLNIVNRIINSKEDTFLTKNDFSELKSFFKKRITGSEYKIMDYKILIDFENIFIIDPAFKMKEQYYIVKKGEKVENNSFSFHWKITEIKNINFSKDIELIDGKFIDETLIIRSPRKSDQFLPLGSKNYKSIEQFQKDNKISFDIKNNSLVICNKDRIVCLAGQRIDDSFKITDSSKRAVMLSYMMK